MSERKTALVTGASRGLGRAVALELGRRGVAVGIVARDRLALKQLEAEIAQYGVTALVIEADLTDDRDIDRVIARTHDAFGAVDLLVNNAATLGPTPLPLLLDLEPEALQQSFVTNVIGPFRLTRALTGPMVLRGEGVVVAISSDAAVESYPRWGAYGASKAAQDHLWRTFAAELADTGVRFVVFDPGEMDTKMHSDALPEADPATLRKPGSVARSIVDRLLAPDATANGARLMVEV